MNANNLSGDELKHLTKYTNLHTIKFAGNNVTDFAQLEAIVRIIGARFDIESDNSMQLEPE